MPHRTGAAVALVNMPVYITDTPSLGLGLLKAGLAKEGIPREIYYLNLWFAERIGLELHRELLSWPQLDLASEWIFSKAFWGANAERDNSYIRDVIEGGAPEHRDARNKQNASDFVKKLIFCQNQVEPFLDFCLKKIPWKNFQVVGFHSQFQQQMASLALARRLKELYPELFIVFGGTNARAEMGQALLNSFPFIDAACTGEGDVVFPQLVIDLKKGVSPIKISGILCRGSQSSHREYPLVTHMDQLPYPDFGDFFSQRADRSNLKGEDYYLVLETSRGCWWGQGSQCTFCGLHKDEILFRQKSEPGVLREIKWMLRKYGRKFRTLLFTDLNMSHNFVHSLWPDLSKLKLRKDLFFETRILLRKEHVRLLRNAGVRMMQPGIETFSKSLLRRIRKGTTCLQNIQFLKWCSQFGIRPGWNFIFGFPGENPDDYRRLPDIVRAICHLPPPVTIGKIRFDRFSPYYARPSEFGVRNLRPLPSYRYIYPSLDSDEIKELAYFFVGDFDGQPNIESYTENLIKAVDDWLGFFGKSALFTLDRKGQSIVCDFRPDAEDKIVPLSRVQRRLYEACDQIQSRSSLHRLLSSELGCEATGEQLDSVLAPLLDRRFLLEEDDKYLGLSVSLEDEYFPPEAIWSQIPEILSTLDRL